MKYLHIYRINVNAKPNKKGPVTILLLIQGVRIQNLCFSALVKSLQRLVSHTCAGAQILTCKWICLLVRAARTAPSVGSARLMEKLRRGEADLRGEAPRRGEGLRRTETPPREPIGSCSPSRRGTGTPVSESASTACTEEQKHNPGTPHRMTFA